MGIGIMWNKFDGIRKPYDQDQSGHTVFFLQIPACNRAEHTFRMKYGIVDRHSHDICAATVS